MASLDLITQWVAESFVTAFGSNQILMVILLGVAGVFAIKTKMDRATIGSLAFATSATFYKIGLGSRWLLGVGILISAYLIWAGITKGGD